MIRKLLATVTVAATAFVSTAASADYKPLEGDPTEVNFGIIATESTSSLKNQWLPFLADMEDALGMKVNAFFAPDYAGVIEAMRFGKVTVAWFGNKSAMEAVDRAGGEIFSQTAKEDGTQGYYSHLLAHADNEDINTLEDVLKCDQSLDFGIGDPNSTSGFLVPSYYVFAMNGATPADCFKTVRSANHETNLMAVANKQVDVATNNSEQVARSRTKRPEAGNNVKVVWTSPLIPSDPMVYRTDLSDDFKARIKAFFLGYARLGADAEKERAVLAGISDGMGPFTDSDNTQLYPIRQLALFKDKLKIENDDRLDAADKKAKIEAIEAELKTLEVLSANQ